MARYRKRVYRKKVAKPMTWRRAAGQTLSLATKAGVKYVRRKLGLNTEIKWKDTTISAAALTGTAAFKANSMLVIPQGDAYNNRSGDDIRVTACNFKYLIYPSAAATVSGSVRVLIVGLPKQFDGTTGTGTSYYLTDTTNLMSPYNMDNTGYRILYDRTHHFAQNAQTLPVEGFFNFNPADWHLKWTTTGIAGAIADLRSGYFNIIAYDNYSANHPTFEAYMRLKYVDN